VKFVQVKYPDTKLLQRFIEEAGSSLKTFRYFQKRPLEVIQNHLCTFLLLEGEEPVAYGHLDVEDEATVSSACGSDEKIVPGKKTIWLGVAVSEKHVGEGYGALMMKQLLDFAKENHLPEIKLSVDNSNTAAINLYQKLGFKLIERKETFGFYVLKIKQN
jgi:ribosomal protein S18 acetylase RimI-like enzyme